VKNNNDGEKQKLRKKTNRDKDKFGRKVKNTNREKNRKIRKTEIKTSVIAKGCIK